MDTNIQGEKIFLRLMTGEDTEQIVQWRNKERVKSRFIYQEKFTREGHENWIKTMVETGKVVQFIICERETKKPVGSVYFRDICETHHKAEYGIFIGEDDAVGKGYATEAARLAIEYGFKELKLHKIMLRVFADNHSAIRSYEKAGFVQEAFLKDEVCINEKFCDMILMAVIQDK